jgi:hypothetical protein
MAKKRLTDRTLRTLKPAQLGRRYDIMDADVPGLGVRVTDKDSAPLSWSRAIPAAEIPPGGHWGSIPSLP